MAGFKQRLSQQLGPRPQGQIVSYKSKGGGGGAGGAGAFMRQYQAQASQRTEALKQQREQTLRLGRAAFERARGELSKVGGAARERIGQSREGRLARSQQSLISRGLGNTTILGSRERGIESDIGREQGSLDEMLARMRAGLEERAGGFELNLGQFGLQSMGAGPNMSDFMQMLSQLSQYS